jgi:long-chain acyl-CoA synthetase
MSYLLILLATTVFAYVVFVFIHLGFPGRLILLSRWNGRIDEVLEESVRRHGNRELIELAKPLQWSNRRTWTPTQMLDAVKDLSACLAHLGVSEGDRVAIYKANDFDYFLFSVAIIRIGGIAVPMNVNVAADIAARYMERMGVSVLLTDCAGWQKLHGDVPATLNQVVLADGPAGPALADYLVHSLPRLLNPLLPRAKCHPRGPSDPLYIVHTSGTTGIPKGVILKSEGLAQSLRSVMLFNLVSPRDLASFALPLNHQVSHLYLLGTLLMGVKCIINGELAAPALIQQIEQYRPTIFFGFPITYTRLMAAGAQDRALDSIRIWGTTADASHEVQQRTFVSRGSFFRRLGIPLDGSLFIDGLGSSEVGIAALLRVTTPWTKRFERRVGRRTPLGPKIKVADNRGRPVSKGQAGLLMIKGKSMFGGYWNAHDTLYASSRDGWWFTGDVVQAAKDGEMLHLDREVDVMHTTSGPIYTLPMEEIILKHPSVLDTSVFGVRTDRTGLEVPAAVVALRADAQPIATEALLHALNQRLPAEQRLAHMWVIDWDDFPIGATGKTLKRRLRECYNALLQAPATPPSPQQCMLASVN